MHRILRVLRPFHPIQHPRLGLGCLCDWLIIVLLAGSPCCLPAQSPGCIPPHARTAAPAVGVPLILYTDIQSGPTSGGEHNQGIYLSIFGMNFGSVEGIGHQTKALLGGHNVASYRYFGPSKGRPDIQQITVQVGSLGGARQGRPLPVVVEVAGMKSNANITFTPNPGTIFFADNVRGEDSTAKAGDINHPYRHIQMEDPNNGGVWPDVKPGDFIVMRATERPWQDTGFDHYFLRIQKSGTKPSGKVRTGPITLMGYPGEDVFIDETFAVSHRGAIAGINGPHGAVLHRAIQNAQPNHHEHGHPEACEQNGMLLCSQWITIADLRIEGGGDDGPVNLEIGGNHWRVVNNSLSAETGQPSARSGGITGDGIDAVLLGNTVHNINSPDPGLENHGIYIDGPGSYKVEYNYIHDVPGGSGFQIYGDETATGSYVTNNVIFSHNWIDHVAKYCVNLADNSGSGVTVFDNVSSFCGMAGLRINSSSLRGAKVYNNTFFASDSSGDDHYGAIVIDSKLGKAAVEAMNNIFMPLPHMPYMGGDTALLKPTPVAHFTNNLYSGGGGSLEFDVSPITETPVFANAVTCDFHLGPTSGVTGLGSRTVKNTVTNDFDLNPYKPGLTYDLGAYKSR
jgi:Right handed beta helix region